MAAANHAITVSFEEAATATGLRKPSDRDGELRIVTIDGIDRGACGGTHCDRTGEIGSILLRRVEKTKGNTRIEFVCGLRAVQRARLDATLLSTAARMFTAAPEDVPALLDAQQRRVTTLERERKQFVAELAAHDARARWSAAPLDAAGVRRILIDAYDGPVKDAEPLVQAIVAMGSCVVLVLSPSTNGAMLGAGELSGVDAGKALREALQTIGGRGGGSLFVAELLSGNRAGGADRNAACLSVGRPTGGDAADQRAGQKLRLRAGGPIHAAKPTLAVKTAASALQCRAKSAAGTSKACNHTARGGQSGR